MTTAQRFAIFGTNGVAAPVAVTRVTLRTTCATLPALSVAMTSITFGPGFSSASTPTGTPRPTTPTSSNDGASTPLTNTWTRTTSTLSLTRPVTRIFSSVSLASGGGWLIAIFGASVSPFRGSARGVGGDGAGVDGTGSRRGASTGGRCGSAGCGAGDATTGGGGGVAARLSSQLRPLRLPRAFTN